MSDDVCPVCGGYTRPTGREEPNGKPIYACVSCGRQSDGAQWRKAAAEVTNVGDSQ